MVGVVVMCLALTNPALAVNMYWQVDTGNWGIGSNWRNGEPTSSDSAYLSNGGLATIDRPGESCYTLYLGYLNGERGTLEMTAGGLSTGKQYLGYDGTGTFNQSGGTVSSGYPLYLGYNSGSEGTYNLSQTGQLSVGADVYVGLSGTGTFNQSGGTASLGSAYYDTDLYVGYQTGSSGTYNLSGTGELSAVEVRVGRSGTGTFKQSGGTSTISGSLYLGYYSSGSTGTFIQSGGTNTISDSLYLGYSSGNTGAYTLSETGELSAGYQYIGRSGTGSVTQTGGTNTISDWLYMGYLSGTTGTYTLSGGELLAGGLSGAYESIGHNGNGFFTHTAGRNTITGSLVLAYNSGGSATYTLGGTGELLAAYEQIGREGTASFTQTGGTNTISDSLYLGYYPRSGGTYHFSGGTLTMSKGIDRSVKVGVAGGTGVFNLGDASATGVIGESGAGGGVSLTVRNSVGSSSSGTFRGWGTVALTGTLENNGRIIADGYGGERTLDLSSFSSVRNDDSYGFVQGDGTRAGWYAENQGTLILPPISVSTGSNTYNWGEEPGDGTIDLVNSLRISLANVTSGGVLSVSLLTPDNPTVPPLPTGSTVGLWDFSPPTGFAFASADVTFRYDDTLAALLGLNEEELNVYRFTGGDWVSVTTSIDTTNKRISAEGIDSFSTFAVGAGNPPPPTPNQWNLSEGGYYGVDSRWNRNSVPNGVDAVANFLGMIEDDSTVQVQSPVTVGTINFDNTHSYTIAGPAAITLQTSSGDAQINVLRGNHAISAPLWFVSGLTVDTAETASLTIDPTISALVAGNLTKDGPGTLVIGGGLLLTGDVHVNQGTLQLAEDVLALRGGDVTIGPGSTLKAAGIIPRRVVDGGSTPWVDEGTLEATGDLVVGQLSRADGFDYLGRLVVGSHSVVLLDADQAEVGWAQLAGGSLSSAKVTHLRVASEGRGGSIEGHGTLYGVVVAGTRDEMGGIIFGTSDAQRLDFPGILQGNWALLINANINVLKAGFSPGISPLGPNLLVNQAAFEINGADEGTVDLAGPFPVTEPGNMSRFIVHGLPGGAQAGPTVFDGITIGIDPSWNNFQWTDLNAGDDLVLLETHAWKVNPVLTFGKGSIDYTTNFDSQLAIALQGMQLRDGLSWDVEQTAERLALTVVPEPGTLALLLTGGLGLLVLVWRRKAAAMRDMLKHNLPGYLAA